MRDFLAAQTWDAFFTATFRNHQRYSGTAIAHVERTLTQHRLKPQKMFIAAEQHRLGGWHCHGLLEYPMQLFHPFQIVATALDLGALGYNLVGRIGDQNACSAYLSKYLTKDELHGDWKMVGRRKFWKGVDNVHVQSSA
jgi:hypothetical protein